ncbi:ferredoxin [Patescibacteria group bacterium]
MVKYKINKEKCIGCGVCVATCDGATELGEDGKAKILNQEKLNKCGGIEVCSYEAIEKEEN